MPTTRTRRVEELFHEAFDLDREARAAFLDRHCADEPALRREVEELLRHEQGAPPAFLTGRRGEGESALLPAGQRVGRFEILRPIGAGGMGTVYEARQDHPRRTVALKLIRSERADPEVLRRFRHEADVLAVLQHPGIAQIYEAGSAPIGDVEQPFFAMEMVRGESLLAAAARLDLRSRAELVARICDAAQHAHQRGIIHRDLKPENILVVEREPGTDTHARFRDVGQPKILDFGIARATGPGSERTTLETRAGHLVGTLEYMSPEQLSGDPRAIDTRSDVYALGVLLYELLVDRPPIDLAGASLLECARRIQEEPAVPARRVNPAIPAELAAICSKALEKHPDDRYASAGDLAADLRRFLSGEPVAARSHSTFYVVRKSLRRHRTAATVGGVLLGLLIAFGTVSSIQASRNRRLAGSLGTELRANNIERGRVLAHANNLQAAEELIWAEHLAAPSSRHSHWALWETYSLHPNLGTWPINDRRASVAFHPSGELFATAGEGGFVHFWDASGRGARRQLSLGVPVRGLDFRLSDGLLALGTGDGRLLTWRLDRDEPELDVQANPAGDGVLAAIFSPAGNELVTGGELGSVRVWDPATGELLRELAGHTQAVMALAFAPDGSALASAGNDGAIRVWEELEGAPAQTLAVAADSVLALAFSPDGRTLAWGGTDKRVHLWDLQEQVELDTFEAPNGSVRFLAFDPRGEALVSGGWWSVLAWELDSGERSTLAGRGLWGGALRPDGALLATGDVRGVGLWDLAPRDALRLARHSGRVVGTLSPDGSVLATGDEEGTLRTWDARSGQLLRELPLHSARIRALDFTPDGATLLAGSGSGSGRLVTLDAVSGEVLLELDEHHDMTVAAAAFGPEGRRLAHISPFSQVHVHDVETGALVHEWAASELGVEVLGLAFAPDGRLATTARDDLVRIWTDSGELLMELSAPQGPWRPVFSDDGSRLAVGSWAPAIYVYDMATGERLATLEGHRAVVWDVAFAPGSVDTLASASDDGTVKLWEVENERCLLTLDDFEGWDVFSVAFGPDRMLAAGGRRAAVIWDLEYFDRHVAANVDNWLALRGDDVDEQRRRLLEAWADEVLQRPWPRFPPAPDRR